MLVLWSVLDVYINFQSPYERSHCKTKAHIRNDMICNRANSYQSGTSVELKRDQRWRMSIVDTRKPKLRKTGKSALGARYFEPKASVCGKFHVDFSVLFLDKAQRPQTDQQKPNLWAPGVSLRQISKQVLALVSMNTQ